MTVTNPVLLPLLMTMAYQTLVERLRDLPKAA